MAGAAAACIPTLRSGDTAREAVTLDLSRGRLPAPVVLTYLGVGGWLVETPGTRILTAPLFSNPSIWRTGFAPIAADTVAIGRGLDRFGAGRLDDVTAILSGHAHYDHLMDVPWIAARRAPGAVIYTNATGVHTLAPAARRLGLAPDRIVDLGPDAADREGGGRWLGLGPDLRLLPLRSSHAPHFAGLELYDGRRSRDLREEPRAADEWLGGEAVAFLLEVLDGSGQPALRLYIQDAVAEEPFGFVPEGTDSVDVAVIVPASFAEAEWHPEAVLSSTRARHVLLGHWEDFFQPPSADPDPVPGTALGEFVRRLRRFLDGDDGRWTLPVPGTRVEIH